MVVHVTLDSKWYKLSVLDRFICLFYIIQKKYEVDEKNKKNIKVTAKITVLFVSKSFTLLDITEHNKFDEMKESIELEVNVCFHCVHL